MVNDNWIKNIFNITEENKKDLLKWMDILGHYRYKDFYFKVVNIIKDKDLITYDTLKDLARYYFDLTDIAFSSLKFAERKLRAIILDNSIEDVNKQEMSYGNHNEYIRRCLSINSPINVYLKENVVNISLKQFIESTSLNSLSYIFNCLPISIIEQNGINKTTLRGDLKTLCEFRNSISHCNNMFEYGINNNLCENFKITFKYISSSLITKRRKQELRDLYIKYIQKCPEQVITILKQNNLLPYFNYS